MMQTLRKVCSKLEHAFVAKLRQGVSAKSLSFAGNACRNSMTHILRK